MDCVTVRDPRESIDVMAITDPHFGARGSLYAEFERAVQRALRERMHVLGLGDWFDLATTTSLTPWADEERPLQVCFEYCCEWLGKLADAHLLDALVGGNHRRRMYRHSGFDIEEALARRIGVPFFSASGVVRYTIGNGKMKNGARTTYSIYLHHTARGGRLAGSAFNAVEALTQIYEGADFYLGGHTHKCGATTTRRYSTIHTEWSADTVQSRTVWLVCCGSFLEYGGSYAEEAQMTPAPPGYAILHLTRREKDRRRPSVDIVDL